MRNYDLTPFYRSTVGFDRFFSLLDQAASDGSPGHIMNTLWGLQAAECLGLDLSPAPKLSEWVRACQLPSGGFT